MFKSIFAKYISAFMLIVLLSFSVIILMISVIIGDYAADSKTEIMENAASSCISYLESKATMQEDLETILRKERSDVQTVLAIAASHTDDITILLVDPNGTLLLAVGSDPNEVAMGSKLPSSLIAEATADSGWITQDIEELDVFQNIHSIYALPFYGESNELCGTILVCASSALLTELRDAIVKTIVTSILWILLAVMIAVYFITERMISPLREISAAAKSFADGNFDVRVPVRGSDEISELAIAFNNMAESMNNYDTMRNTFMSNVSHDLRTPMTSISGFIDGILDGVIPPDRHEYYLRLVAGEVKRLSRLVSSLLDLSRIQAGERKFTMTSFDICEMGRQILISFEQKIYEKQLNVDFDCDEEKMNVLADRDAIHQIFYNLCDNAVKFSSEGGKFRIAIRKLKNRKVLVSVYNDGQGISQADLPYVFDRFYKSDKSRGLNKSGVGLGLFIAKTIVDAHHEKIWVESEYSKNCCFNFTLSGE